MANFAKMANPNGCCISNCVSNSITIKDIKYYPFPEDRDSWMTIISQQVKGFSYKPNSKLCSLHFHRNVLALDNKLREGAMPRFFRLTGNSLEASVKRCCIMGCNSTSNTTEAANFFQFPEDKNACAAWLNAIRLKNFQNIIPNKNKYLCALHFPMGTPAAMIPTTVPSIFFRKRLLNGDIIQRTEEQKADKAGPEAVKKSPTEDLGVEKKPELIVIDDNDEEEDNPNARLNLPSKILKRIQHFEAANSRIQREVELLKRKFAQVKRPIA